jgi:acyl-coenzyme A thioesterase PaaI-like protein
VTPQFIRKMSGRLPVQFLRRLANLWAPFRGSGIYIISITPDYRELNVKLRRKWWNTNYVGTQFGGSIYAMVDPFYMMMVMNNLGPGYIVWDKAAKIDFKKPGKTELFAHFKITSEQLVEIKARADAMPKYIFDLEIDVKDPENQVIATVTKTLYVRRKVAEKDAKDLDKKIAGFKLEKN